MNEAKRISAKTVALTGMTAALYVVMTVAFPLSYEAVQFRLSEVLLLLALFDRRYVPGLVLGCALANLFSPLGLIDVAVGTTATYLALAAMVRTKSPFLATLWPAVSNGIFVGLELMVVDNLPLWFGAATVAFGELVVVTTVGYPLYRLLSKNDRLIEFLKS